MFSQLQISHLSDMRNSVSVRACLFASGPRISVAGVTSKGCAGPVLWYASQITRCVPRSCVLVFNAH